ncbi:MAG: hypothetical protein MUO50_13850 [Longimicrobiales bacterium]|nr:hypothetical protein [Longimicrobiales bacterium]
MDPAISLVSTYLKLNGYFTSTELPVIKKGSDGLFFEVTDIDILALRFPRASHIVAQGRPGPIDDLHFPPDPELDIPSDAMDLIIGEVKAGRPRLNPHMRSDDALYMALVRFGFCPPDRLDRAVEELKKFGQTWVRDGGVAVPSRVRLVAFGDGEQKEGEGYTVIPLKRVAAFVMGHLKEFRDVLHPIRLTDPTLGLLHLLEKLDGGEGETSGNGEGE